MTNNIQCSIESSTTKIELNSATEGVFLVPELEGLAGLPEIRTTSGVNAGYDGGWTSAQNYDARLITIRGVIANPDVSQVEAKRRAIASLLGQGRKEQLTLRITTEAGNSYAISVRTISCEMALQRVLTTQEFLIQLRADDPLIYDDGASAGTEAILYVQQALGGFEINFGLPLAIGGGAEDTVVQNGEETVYPILKLYGPLHRPTVVNTTTNQQMQLDADLQYTINWSGYETESGDYITISDAIEDAPLTLTQLSGNAEQTTYSGKNKIYLPNGTYTSNAVVWTVTDDTIKVNGTANSDWTIPMGFTTFSQPLPAGQYTFSIPSAIDKRIQINIKDESDVAHDYSIYEGSTSVSFTTTWTSVSFRFALRAGNGTTVNINIPNKLQLESGSTATAYEPYVGGTPAPNPDYPQAVNTTTGEQTVSVVGKNLFNVLAVGEVADHLVNNGDGTLTVTTYNNNTFVNNGKTLAELCPSLKVGDTATLSATSTGTGKSIYLTDGGGSWNFGTSKTITSAMLAGKVCFYASGVSTTATISDIQLELGSTATTYEPYQGQTLPVNLGKNLFSISQDTIISNAYLKNNATLTFDDLNSVSITATGTQGAQYLYRIITGLDSTKNYTFSFKGTKNVKGSTGLSYIRITTYGSNDGSTWTNLGVSGENNPTQGTTYSFTKTLTGYTQYRFMVFNNADTPVQVGEKTTYSEMMLELGSTATTYAPYFTPIELAKIGDYQDYIWNDNGVWKIHKEVGKVVLDGSESWTAQASNTGYMYRLYHVGVGSITSSSMSNLMSDYFTPTTGANIYSVTSGGYMAQLTVVDYIRFNIGDTTNKLADFKTWLGSHNATVYYQLATPTDTEITDDTLLAQLNTISELYGGVNNISLVPSAGAQGTMEVKYATVKTITQDVAVIDSQARTITINGQDAYHLKTDESEFLLLAPGENKLYLTSASETDEGYAEVKFKQGYLSI